MRTIQEYEELMNELREARKQGRTNILCPNCKDSELKEGDVVLLSNPPQKRVFCNNCGYITTIPK